MTPESILKLAKTYADHRSLALATVSLYAANDGKFFNRLEGNSTCTFRRAEKLTLWFSENWPIDLEWPREIPRPNIKRVRSARAAS